MILLLPARKEHGDFLLGMRNDPELIAFGDSGQPADASWLEGDLEVIYAPVGFVRRDGDEVSIAVLKGMRGQGIGAEALVQVRLIRGHTRARVKQDNLASQRAFEKAGYRAVAADTTHVIYEGG